MADKSSIEWTDATWNPVRGCSRVSEGCRNCYAERVAARFSGPGQAYEGLARMTDAGPRWTGEVRLVEEHLRDPLKWKRPRRIFVNSMSDLFHESLDDFSIQRVFDVMYNAEHHIYQILTKRPKRMMDFLNAHRGWWGDYPQWKHVWLGVSVEDQKTADERIPLLLKTPAASRWVSAEPLLGPIDLGRSHPCGYYCDPDEPDGLGHHDHDFWTHGINTSIKWVVVGGESGPNARPMHPRWARDLRDQCVDAGVQFFFKQWGMHLPAEEAMRLNLNGAHEYVEAHPGCEGMAQLMVRVGKKAAGRLLDGREWNEMPEVATCPQ